MTAMRALVVGCDTYPALPDAGAHGAAAGALDFRAWLLRAGGVEPGQLRLLLTSAAPVGPGVTVHGPADVDSFTAEVRRLVTGPGADRLWVYIAGLAYRSDPDRPYLAQDLLAFGDIDPGSPAAACVAVTELTTQLAQGDFREIVTVLDCRTYVSAVGPVQVTGFGDGWQGSRRSGAAARFLVRGGPPGELTAAVLNGLNGAAAVPATADPAAAVPAARVPAAGVPVTAAPGADERALSSATGPGGLPLVVRWWSLQRHLLSVLADPPPTCTGPDPGLLLTRPVGAPARTGSLGAARVAEAAPARGSGQFQVRSVDPNAMVTVEDGGGTRVAVGVGSIEGALPYGRYTAVLADPAGADPRRDFVVGPGRQAEVTLVPGPRSDGFRVTAEGALGWSSSAAQLAAATREVWSAGTGAYLLVGGTAEVAFPEVVMNDDAPGPPLSGSLRMREKAWWLMVPVRGPWRSIELAGRRITIPAAPDSVTAMAVSGSSTTVALFDITHADPDEIAAQDRVQEYLGSGLLGAADLTSRLVIEAGRRWPWAATAAIRRLIDGTRTARAATPGLSHGADGAGSAVPIQQFVTDVPPAQRHLLVGRGPWAVWLDRV